MREPTLNQRWAASLVGTLVAEGVRHAVICPGSRSTPLALAWAARADVHCWSVIDERSAAFFALGIAKRSDAPVAVVCTSGTAGGHFLPAVMEASEACVPLVLLTADRPWELHGFGAPQTIEQRALFGGYVRANEALSTPDEAALAHLPAAVSKVCLRGLSAPRGPVHVNVPFREPLAPPEGDAGPIITPALARPIERQPEPRVPQLEQLLLSAKRGVVIAGPHDGHRDFGAWVHRIANQLQFPVLAEAASNARFGFPDAVAHADALLRVERFAAEMKPDVVLRLGGGLTPKVPQAWLDGSGAKVVQAHDEGLRFDPLHRVQHPFLGRFELGEHQVPASQRAYRAAWLAADRAVAAMLDAERPAVSEPLVARAVVQALPEGSELFISSSMPIRDVDAFASSPRHIRVSTNRGVNGIDGILSTALGVAVASKRPTVVLTGDVALLHDLGGWLIAKRHGIPLTVVCVNNDGGGIFHFLPIAEKTASFETLFGTPHGIALENVAGLVGASFQRAESLGSLQQAVTRGLGGGLHLIEVQTRRDTNVLEHRALFARLSEVVR